MNVSALCKACSSSLEISQLCCNDPKLFRLAATKAWCFGKAIDGLQTSFKRFFSCLVLARRNLVQVPNSLACQRSEVHLWEERFGRFPMPFPRSFSRFRNLADLTAPRLNCSNSVQLRRDPRVKICGEWQVLPHGSPFCAAKSPNELCATPRLFKLSAISRKILGEALRRSQSFLVALFRPNNVTQVIQGNAQIVQTLCNQSVVL